MTDVWETRRAVSASSPTTKIGPITQEVGVDGPPEVTMYEVHNYLTAG